MKTRKIGNAMRTGRRQVNPEHLISPLGYNGREDNHYTPASAIKGSKTGKAAGGSKSKE